MSVVGHASFFGIVLPCPFPEFDGKNPRHILSQLQQVFKVILAIRVANLSGHDGESDKTLIEPYSIRASQIRESCGRSAADREIEQNVLAACLATTDMIFWVVSYLNIIKNELVAEKECMQHHPHLVDAVGQIHLIRATAQSIAWMTQTTATIQIISQSILDEIQNSCQKGSLAKEGQRILSTLFLVYDPSSDDSSPMAMLIGIVENRLIMDEALASSERHTKKTVFEHALLQLLAHCKILFRFAVDAPIRIGAKFAHTLQTGSVGLAQQADFCEKIQNLKEFSSQLLSQAIPAIDHALPADLRAITWRDFYGND